MGKGLKYLFLIEAIIAFAFGVGLIFIPETLTELTKWTPVDPTMMRELGAAMLAISFGSWLGFRAREWEQVQILARIIIGFNLLGFLSSLYSVLFGNAPVFAWSNVAIGGILGALFAYYGRRPKPKIAFDAQTTSQ